MSGSGALSSSDWAWAQAVERYIEERGPEAETLLTEPALTSFRDFCALWQRRFALRDLRVRRDYLEYSPSQRDELFQRFVREAESWDRTLSLSSPGLAGVPMRSAGNSGVYDAVHTRVQRLAEKEARSRSFYERLSQDVEWFSAAQRLPWTLHQAFRVLDLPPGAPLDEVRRSYRRLAVEHHPDRDGDSETMIAVSDAYRSIVDYYKTTPETVAK